MSPAAEPTKTTPPSVVTVKAFAISAFPLPKNVHHWTAPADDSFATIMSMFAFQAIRGAFPPKRGKLPLLFIECLHGMGFEPAVPIWEGRLPS